MIHRGNVLLDVQDKNIDVLIVFCNKISVWDGLLKTNIKTSITQMYSTDMRMDSKNKSSGGFSYYVKNDILFINAYVLDDHDNIALSHLETFLNDKLKNNIDKIFNKSYSECRYGIVLPDVDYNTALYINDYMSQYINDGNIRLYRLRKVD